MKVLAVCCLLLEIQTKEGTELFLAYFKDLHGWTNGSVLMDSHRFGKTRTQPAHSPYVVSLY